MSSSLRMPQKAFLECKPRSAASQGLGPEGLTPQLSGELARLRAEYRLMMSESCASWPCRSPPCRRIPSAVGPSWELSLVMLFQQDNDIWRASERSPSLTRKPDRFYDEVQPPWASLRDAIHVSLCEWHSWAVQCAAWGVLSEDLIAGQLMLGLRTVLSGPSWKRVIQIEFQI